MEALIDLAGPEATHALGERLGRLLAEGDFIGLHGDLGAGKTLLVRGLALGLGIGAGQVQSPTFTIINRYVGGRLLLHHADLYRLEGRDELYATGYFDLLQGEGALVTEWVERIAAAAPAERLDVTLEQTGERTRRARAVAHGPRAEALLAAFTSR
ncbi:MAG: tRNA (adenosine(37)-N6)-threonylcarbamoyltransferase complex ATPase subunit type 1 TsaE [Deltaproteobacteria bacterium]